jgi:hypothetical protein
MRLSFFLTLLLGFALSACGISAEPAKGYVLEVVNPDSPTDQWELRPVENADVIVLWKGGIFGESFSAHSSGRCLKAEYARTGKDGMYSVHGWTYQDYWWRRSIIPWSYAHKTGLIEFDEHSVLRLTEKMMKQFPPPGPNIKNGWHMNNYYHVLKPKRPIDPDVGVKENYWANECPSAVARLIK